MGRLQSYPEDFTGPGQDRRLQPSQGFSYAKYKDRVRGHMHNSISRAGPYLPPAMGLLGVQLKELDPLTGPNGSWWPGFKAPNMALEFDPGWAVKHDPTNPHVSDNPSRSDAVVARCVGHAFLGAFSSIEKLWFTNYKIRRRAGRARLVDHGRQFQDQGAHTHRGAGRYPCWELDPSGVFRWLR